MHPTACVRGFSAGPTPAAATEVERSHLGIVEERKRVSAPLAACELLRGHLGAFLEVSRCLQVLIGTQRDFPKLALLKVFRH